MGWDAPPDTYLYAAARQPSGTGSASLLNMTDEEKKAAEKKRKKNPVGFQQPKKKKKHGHK